EEVDDANGSCPGEQRKYAARRQARSLDQRQPWPRTRVIGNVVADAGLAGSESRASQTLALGNRRIRRETKFRGDLGKGAGMGCEFEPGRPIARREDCRAQKLAL